MEIRGEEFYKKVEREIDNFVIGGANITFNSIIDVVLINENAPLSERKEIPTVMVNKYGYPHFYRYQYEDYEPEMTPEKIVCKFRNVEYRDDRDKGTKKSEMRKGQVEQFNEDYKSFLIAFDNWFTKYNIKYRWWYGDK